MRKLPNSTSGQALLLVLLSMSVVLTIVLSILARSTVDIGVSTRSEESVRAFSAAEAGIEQALVAGSTGTPVTIGDASFVSGVSGYAKGLKSFVFPWSYWSGESATVWFVSHDPTTGNLSCSVPGDSCYRGNQIQVCWGKEGTSSDLPTTPAIEVSVVYLYPSGDYTKAMVAREVADPFNNSAPFRTPANSFPGSDGGASCVIGGQTFAFKKTIYFDHRGFKLLPASIYTQPNGLQLARIRFLYNTDSMQPVAISADSDLPSQGTQIVSTGTSGSSNRKVEVIRGYKELPLNLTGGVFAEDGIQ